MPDIEILEDNSLILEKKSDSNLMISNLQVCEIAEDKLFMAKIEDKGHKVRIRCLSDNHELISRKIFNLILPFCMYQMGRFVFHASAISFNNKATLFLGNSGAGKSTITLKFPNSKFISEDIVSIISKNDKLFSVSSFPYVKLTKNVAISSKKKFEYEKIIEGDRLSRSFFKLKEYSSTPQEIKNFIFLKWSNSPSLRKLNSQDILKNLLISSINEVPRGSCLLSKKNFMSFVEKVSLQCEFYEYKRPKDLNYLKRDKSLEFLLSE